MIRSFKHAGLERFFKSSDKSGIPPQFAGKLERMLDALDACTSPDGMSIPGYKFHRLTGNRRNWYATSVSGNWRLTFKWDGQDAIDVNLEDYH